MFPSCCRHQSVFVFSLHSPFSMSRLSTRRSHRSQSEASKTCICAPNALSSLYRVYRTLHLHSRCGAVPAAAESTLGGGGSSGDSWQEGVLCVMCVCVSGWKKTKHRIVLGTLFRLQVCRPFQSSSPHFLRLTLSVSSHCKLRDTGWT